MTKSKLQKAIRLLLLLSVIVLISAGCSERWFGTPRDGTSTVIYDQAKQKLDKANEQATQQAGIESLTVSQTIEGSNLNKADGYQIEAGKTALDLLKSSHQVKTKEYTGIGEFVEEIDGIKPDSSHFWAFYVNGKSSDVGASSYKPQSGDKIEWKLEKIQAF